MSSRTELRFIKSFQASDHGGKNYTIEKWQTFIIGKMLGGTSETPELPQYRTAEGLQLNWLGTGKYEIVVSGLVLTSRDPDAD